MTEKITAYPLSWPPGWRRTSYNRRTRARFNARLGSRWTESLSVAQATRRLVKTFGRMRISNFVISTDTPVRLDGLPRSGAPAPDDPGVAVYWIVRRTDTRRCMAVDHYDRIADNIAAVAVTLEAMRSIERHGGAEILNRAFTGFTALPSPEQWWHVLGFENTDVTLGEVDERYRILALQTHPDRSGGDGNAMARINAARDAARIYITG